MPPHVSRLRVINWSLPIDLFVIMCILHNLLWLMLPETGLEYSWKPLPLLLVIQCDILAGLLFRVITVDVEMTLQ